MKIIVEKYQMNKKLLFLIIFLVLILYPVYTLVHLEQVRTEYGGMKLFQEGLNHYQISIWVVWLFMVALAIYYKWTSEKNIFFHTIYGFLLVAYLIYGWYLQQMVTYYGIETGFRDDYTLVVFKTIQSFAISAILTAFLQAAVWWFTRRWHRR